MTLNCVGGLYILYFEVWRRSRLLLLPILCLRQPSALQHVLPLRLVLLVVLHDAIWTTVVTMAGCCK